MAEKHLLVVFTVDDQQFAVNLSCVQRIVRAVEVTHVPQAPSVILGVINVEGEVIPVVNSRRRLGLPERDIGLDDLFIIVRENDRAFALVADEVRPVMELQGPQVIASERVLPGEGYIEGVAKVDEGMIMVLSVDRTLPYDEHRSVQAAIEAKPHPGLSDK